jgi:myo-inositol 2-dehydrogenase/D-chiro-inositol 1-dehydrogenase/scyllo-inositol 2-dehydrogenase (NAD+)
MSIGVCLIGCGAMGVQHGEAWNEREDAEIVAVFDPVEKSRNDAADKLGGKPYATYAEAIDHDGVQAVSIATPTCFHREIACYALERGRHVLCEKPLAGSRSDCDAMVAAAENSGVHLCVGHQYRDFPRNVRLKRAITEGELGSPILARYSPVLEVRPKLAMHRLSQNMGPVVDVAGHFVDLMRYFTESEPTQVFATGAIYGRGKPRLESIDDDDLAVDAAHMQVRFEGGHAMTLEVVWGMPEDFPGSMSEQVIGPKGLMRKTPDSYELVFGKDEIETLDSSNLGPAPRVNDLADAITKGRPVFVSGHDGRSAALTCLAAIESIETGRVVEVAAQPA